jgi:predicted DNA-binding transcriptional regulator AlpA
MDNETQKQGLDRIVRYPELQKLFARCKKSIKRHSAVGKLPRLVRDGKIVGMLESEVEAYFQRLREQHAR